MLRDDLYCKIYFKCFFAEKENVEYLALGRKVENDIIVKFIFEISPFFIFYWQFNKSILNVEFEQIPLTINNKNALIAEAFNMTN